MSEYPDCKHCGLPLILHDIGSDRCGEWDDDDNFVEWTEQRYEPETGKKEGVE